MPRLHALVDCRCIYLPGYRLLLLDLDALADCFRPPAQLSAAAAAAAAAASPFSAHGTPQSTSPALDDVGGWLSAGAAVCAVVRAVAAEWERVGSGQLRVVLSLRAEDATHDPILSALPHALRTANQHPSVGPVTAVPFKNPLPGAMEAAAASWKVATRPAGIASSIGAAGVTADEEDVVGLRLLESVTGCALHDLAAAEAAVTAAEATMAVETFAAAAAAAAAVDERQGEEEEEGTTSSRRRNAAGAKERNLAAATAATEAAAVAAARADLNEALREARLVSALRSLTAAAVRSPIVPASREHSDSQGDGTGDASEAETSEAEAWPLHPSEVLVVTSAVAEGAAARLVMDGARYEHAAGVPRLTLY